MKAKEVLDKLQITRPTLTKYVKEGLIKVDSTINGQYNYNEDSVNKLLGIESYPVENTIESPEDSVETNVEVIIANVVEIDNLLIDIMYQLAGMKLLTSESITKLNAANELFKNVKKYLGE